MLNRNVFNVLKLIRFLSVSSVVENKKSWLRSTTAHGLYAKSFSTWPRNINVFCFFPDVFASFGPTFVFQLFSLRTLCLRHDSKLRFLFVTTLLHIFSGICWSWRAILPPSNINCLLYWYYWYTQVLHLCMPCYIKAWEFLFHKSVALCDVTKNSFNLVTLDSSDTHNVSMCLHSKEHVSQLWIG